MDFAANCGECDEDEREAAGQRKGHTNSPTQTRRVAREQIREPSRNGGGADVHKKRQGQQVYDKRQMSGNAAYSALEQNSEKRENKVGDENGEGRMSAVVRGLLEESDESEKNDDGARVGNLALDVAALRNVGAHARGRILWG